MLKVMGSGLLAGTLLACAGARQPTEPVTPPTIVIDVSRTETKVAGQRMADPRQAIAGLLGSKPPPHLLLRATADAPERVLAGVVNEAARVSARLTLELGSLREESVPRQPADCQIIATFAGDTAKAWEVRSSGEAPVIIVTPWQIGDAAQEQRARAELQQAARGSYCHAVLMLSQGTALARVLESWQRVTVGQKVSITLNAGLPEQSGLASERLPPEVIQGIVRIRFNDFRLCYERGLVKDSQLGGQIVVHFTINRVGAVENVREASSTLPDPEVRRCVVDAFKQCRFPPPKGGSVTVAYPIYLAPG